MKDVASKAVEKCACAVCWDIVAFSSQREHLIQWRIVFLARGYEGGR